jgi:hypothetical protein
MPAKVLRIALRTIARIPLLLKTLSSFSPAWIILASQKGSPSLALQTAEKSIILETNQDLKPAITLNERRANIFMIDESSGRLKVKYAIPITPLAEKKIEMSHATVELIRKLRPSLGKNLPEISKHRTKKSLLEFTKGISGEPLDPNNPQQVSLLVDLLADFGKVSIDENEMQRIPETFDVRGLLTELAKACGLTQLIEHMLGRAQIIHGDLDKRNILLHEANPPFLVLIDFEHAKVGPGVLNWYDFLLRNFLFYEGQLPIKANVILKRCRRLPGNKDAKETLNRLTAKFLESCGVSLALHGQLIALYMSYLCRDPVVSDFEHIIRHLKSTDFNINL